MKGKLAIAMALLFITSSFAMMNRIDEKEENATFYTEEIERSVKASIITMEGNCSTLQPIVIITNPEDGATFYTRSVTVLGYATDEAGMNYWEWTWEWEGGSHSNSSYFETAEYVEFRIDIYGLALGWNRITVSFRNIYGAYGSDSITIYYEDIYSPIVVITSPEDGSEVTTQYVNVEGYADDQDGSGIIRIEWEHEWEGGSEGDSQVFTVPYKRVTFSIPITLRDGENIITVIAEDLAGNTGEDSISIILLEPLVADANGPYHGEVNEEIQFNGSATGGKPPYTWHWDFGDGKTSNEQNPKHAYSSEGKYTAILTVTDSVGNTASDSAEVTITENLTADANGPYHGEVKKDIQFHGSASGGKPPYTWHWDFGDGKTSNEQNPKHAYNKEGKYTAKLTVTDSEGNKADDTAEVTVYKKLKAEANGPYGGKVGQMIQFHGSASGGVPPYTWLWNFGDGFFSNLQNPTHSYDNAGIYAATLTVTDSIGNIAQDGTFVYIYEEDNLPPFIEITKPVNALYINDREIAPLPFNYSIIIGNITIVANASDNIGVAKVEFYIDNNLKHVNYSYPYYWLWNETAIGKRIIKAIAYDFEGNSAMDEQKVWVFNI